MTKPSGPGRRVPRRPRWSELSDLESRLLAAAVTVPVFTAVALLLFPLGPALTACVLFYASALWLAGNGWLAQRRAAHRRTRRGPG